MQQIKRKEVNKMGMTTRYSVNDEIQIPAKVLRIQVNKEGTINYFVRFTDKAKTQTNKLVYAWVSEDGLDVPYSPQDSETQEETEN
jgi:exoribonuclease II